MCIIISSYVHTENSYSNIAKIRWIGRILKEVLRWKANCMHTVGSSDLFTIKVVIAIGFFQLG